MSETLDLSSGATNRSCKWKEIDSDKSPASVEGWVTDLGEGYDLLVVAARWTIPLVDELVVHCSAVNTETLIELEYNTYCGFCVFLVLNLTPCSCKCLVRKVDGRGDGHFAGGYTKTTTCSACYQTLERI